ncbi:MAG: chemotaxis protein CheV [Proteobacteria bacterium]|nr:chemotaxis protein CheV [Pseudomonadota bacterium]
MSEEILLESGTNEAEFLEFYLGNQSFGINVAKIVQIIEFESESLTALPEAPAAVLGSYFWRDKTIDLIDLNKALNRKEDDAAEGDQDIVLVTTFNDVVTGFHINGVNRIHRVSWDQIQSMDNVINAYSPRFTGTMTVAERNVLLVDFEKIVFELNPELEDFGNIEKLTEEDRRAKRKGIRILFSEDSGFIRKNITKFLIQAGYEVQAFENGLKAYEFIHRSVKESQADGTSFLDSYHLLLTDIEMPQMDGLTLCRRIKEDLGLEMPVVIFSSLIDDQMKVKCREVGADDYVAKPRSPEMVEKIDTILGIFKELDG